MTDVIKILLIEDDEDDYFLTSDYLANIDSPTFEVTWVTNGRDAIQALSENNFDLCLLDYLLGAENGVDVLSALKSRHINLPVVVLTGQADMSVDELVMRAGAADYLQKTEIETPRFMRTIRYALVRRDFENERIERNKIEQKNKAKDKFLAHLSHEIRTPLTSILGYTELLIDDKKNAEIAQELSIIHSNGEHLLSLLNDLLDMSRITVEKLDLNIEEVNLSAFLTDVHSLMLLHAKDKGISLDLVSDTLIPEFIETDSTRLRQVLLNLVSNAVKFTDSGSVTLTVSLDTSTPSTSPRLRFSVADTGIGMPPDELKNIFQPFEQIEEVVRANHGGAGLGLAICNELVAKLGGTISVESTQGVGSTFSFTINPGDIDTQPRVSLMLGNVVAVEPSNIDLQLEGRVLIVDDLRELRRLTGYIVSQCQAHVSFAENGVKALEAVARAKEDSMPFDLVLMDIHMPVMDGLEALHELRGRGHSLPVIAVTAASRKGLKASLIKEGFDDVIGKPIDKSVLVSLLAHYLPAAKTPAASSEAMPHSVDRLNIATTHSPPNAQSTSDQKEILVVEDDEDAAELMLLFLTHLGYSAVVENSGASALLRANEKAFAHILMDLTLPDYNGYDLAALLKEVQPETTLTIVSGHEANKDAMASIGIDSALLKPVTKDDIANALGSAT
jgi:signal transduction histidine kinase